MTLQDLAALAICFLSVAWLFHRLVLRYLPPEKKPDVTAARLVQRTRQRKSESTQAPAQRDCH